MSGLGLDAVAEAVYLTALTRVRWRIVDLARHLDLNQGHGPLDLGDNRPAPGHSRLTSSHSRLDVIRGDGRLDLGGGRFAAAVDQLRTDGLLAASVEESGAIRAVDPALALPAFAASRVWGLSAGDVRPQALAIAQLIARHQPPGPDRLHGLDEMNSFAEHLVANARREVVILSGEHRTGSFEFAAPIAEAVLRRGAQLRQVWRGELIRTPSIGAYATWLRTRGAAPRIVPTLPTTMLLADRSVAMVVNGDEAVVNRSASAVAPLCVLADQVWGKGSPGNRRHQSPAEQTPRHHKVLRLLADGLTDDAIARQVGVSVRTVRNDMAAAMLSLDARSRFQAGVRAAQLGLL
ncbi:helix-turn-helix transcriptional regulator [Kutzneria sp. CA-103260]|uniref:helix-turn-helix transcriptional regulator n=1 Tax=Kutzneria sp. CA-103260 TaxID=2802641 RepID=UPI001BA8EE16|nr:helix-turn-helix transcriptional regulator [Kutzneria sp. CA-103260]